MVLTDSPHFKTGQFVRADGPDKVTGSGRYAADLTLTGMLTAKFRYADVSHANVTKIDVSAARAIPGVFAVITQDDVPNVRFGSVADRTLFVKDVVRFEGEIVAAVAAINDKVAQEACDAIVFEYDELPVVNDIEAAMLDDAPLVHENWESYSDDGGVERDRNVASFTSIRGGDVDAGMDEADHVLTSRYVADGSHALPIEPRGLLAQWEGDRVTIWTSTQVPYQARDGVCETLELPTNRVRIIVPHLGGGFGGKCGFHYESHVAALARVAKRPVKLVFSREEEFLAPDKRREGMVVEITTGIKDDGAITARACRVVVDNGAYTSDSAFFPHMAAMHALGPYKIPNVYSEASAVYTNHQPSGSVRAPTAPQACWAVESHTDELANLIGMDPVEFRTLTTVDTGEAGPTGQVYDEIGLQECIREAVAGIDADDLADDEAIGVAVGWWPSFPGAAGVYVKVDRDGKGMIITGAQECGTGSVMTLPHLAAAELGMGADDFELVYQDTSAAPYDTGATGSQTLLNNGRATVEAAQEVAEQLKALAADKLEAAAEDIVLADGRAHVAGSPDSSISIAKLARIAARGEMLLGKGSGEPPEYPETPWVACVGDQGMSGWAGPQFSCHAVRIRLDKDTGVVRVLEVSAAHDSGVIINPVGASGQVEGGVMMGIGQALTEGTVYGDDGRQQNAALLEYKLQTIADAPPIKIHFAEVPTPNFGPHGSKPIAEAPNVATAAAISNAIAKLIGGPVRQMPMTAERVWAAASGGAE